MKTIRTVVIFVMCIGLLFSATACVVMTPKDNGNHKGWYKNSNNPHHPNSTNPGKSQGHQKK
jgi:hypothetical protein